MTSADLSVRVAWVEDAAAVAGIQLSAWRAQYSSLLPPSALPDDATRAAEVWRASLARPGDARNRVLVALERARPTGFAVTQPASDPDCDPVADAELAELAVHPDERGRGHGSRLLQAAADTMRADRFVRAVAWAVTEDDGLRAFLAGAGWAEDGAHRTLDLLGDGSVTVDQIRFHTALE